MVLHFTIYLNTSAVVQEKLLLRFYYCNSSCILFKQNNLNLVLNQVFAWWQLSTLRA